MPDTPASDRTAQELLAHIMRLLDEFVPAVNQRNNAIDDISDERRRQIEVEGFATGRDDIEHANGELARAAAWYAIGAQCHSWSDVLGPDDPGCVAHELFVDDFYGWPWAYRWWRPKNRRRDLIRAAALIVAEIERLDRLAEKDKPNA